jgi:hypothetical protein
MIFLQFAQDGSLRQRCIRDFFLLIIIIIIIHQQAFHSLRFSG